MIPSDQNIIHIRPHKFRLWPAIKHRGLSMHWGHYLDSYVSWANAGPTSGRQYRRWVNMGPTHIADLGIYTTSENFLLQFSSNWMWNKSYTSPLHSAYIMVVYKLIVDYGVGLWVYELLNLKSIKIPLTNKVHIFHCVGKIFHVEFQTCWIHLQK